MIWKIFGVILVFLGCSGIGGYIVVRNSVRLRMLRELEHILRYMYGEIEYASSDMAEMMESLSARDGFFSVFFAKVGKRVLSHEGLRLADYWKEEMGQIQGIETLHASDRELFIKLGENLGNLDRMTQLRTLELFEKRLSEIRTRAEKEYFGKAKINMVVWVTGGIFLIILFV